MAYNSHRFTDKVAIITGAGNGIGLAMAHMFAAEGATVIIAEINDVAGAGAVRQIPAAGGKAVAHRVDVASEADVMAMVDRAMRELGRMDVLVNNAGVILHKSIIDCELKY